MRRAVIALLLVTPVLAHADSWSASQCGNEPRPPHYDLATRTGYNEAVRKANAYQQAARAYSDCVLKQAHADEAQISRQAQDRIAEIQTIAVAQQQTIYARLVVQAANFKAAAKKLQN